MNNNSDSSNDVSDRGRKFQRFRKLEAVQGAPEIVDAFKSTLKTEKCGRWRVKKGERCDTT